MLPILIVAAVCLSVGFLIGSAVTSLSVGKSCPNCGQIRETGKRGGP